MTPPASQDSSLPDQCDLPRGLPAPLGGRKSLSPFYKREVLQLTSGLPCVRGDPFPSFLQGWGGDIRQDRGYRR